MAKAGGQGGGGGVVTILAGVLGVMVLVFALSHFSNVDVTYYLLNFTQYIYTPQFLGGFLFVIMLAAMPAVLRSAHVKKQRKALARKMSSDNSVAASISEAGSTGGRASAEPVINEFQPLANVDIRRAMGKLIGGKKPDIIKIVDFMIFQAAARHSSDLHLEPTDGETQVKFRVDGVLAHVASFRHDLHRRVVSRLKVMSRLSIYDRDRPQDGRLETRIAGRDFEVRISFLPTLHDEKVVIRLFEASEGQFELRSLGFSNQHLKDLRRLCMLPQGTMYFTGPTGHGKTTTIYSCLRYIQETRHGSVNIMSIEDPIEHDIGGVNQTQVNNARGLDFAAGLRTILRQDPDVIMVGEIRDAETAQIAIRAGLTGHLVFTTIHADSTAGVFTRLIDMGIEPFLLASGSSAVLSQRLIRRICPSCRQKTIPSPETLKLAKIPLDQPMDFYEGRGCPMCMGRGFQGRVGVYELLSVTDELRELLTQKVPTRIIHQKAQEEGLITLMADGLDKVNRGLTSVDEIVRIVAN